MTKKRTSLDALTLESSQPAVEAQPETPKLETTKPDKTVVKQTAYLPKSVHEQLRRLAFEERVKMHDYLMEGLDMVFEKRGLPSIDELKRAEVPV